MENRTDKFTQPTPMLITLDGNIGAGKSTLLKQISEKIKDVDVIFEPVGVWEKLTCENGKSLLSHFYEDPKRWGYTFQNCAILTRILETREAISKSKKKVIITERSVLTDLHVFAKMNKDIGNITQLEWDLYKMWYDGYSHETPITAAIYVTTNVKTSMERINTRGRDGEGNIPEEYMKKLDEYHQDWFDNTDMPVLRINTQENVFIHENLENIEKFVNKLIKNEKK